MKIANLTITKLQKVVLEEVRKRMGTKCFIDGHQTTDLYILVSSWNDNAEFETKIYNNGAFLTSSRGIDNNCIWTKWEENILPPKKEDIKSWK